MIRVPEKYVFAVLLTVLKKNPKQNTEILASGCIQLTPRSNSSLGTLNVCKALEECIIDASVGRLVLYISGEK